ncbi:MAG TPA: LD-carboxypeptidase [Kofleriaceae bacterium]|nr:LD-carboxypeptidase [Kofleriaceae bacterium]
MSQSVSQSIAPARLRPGDTVAIVAPASPVPGERLRAGLAAAGDRYRLRLPDDIDRATGYLAGSDQRRAEELNRALRDPDVRAVWLARGGYGILRLLPLLDADALRADPKPIIGFSDATALLGWALAAAGVRGIHGPVVVQLGALPPEDAAWLFALLEGRAEGPLATGLEPVGAPARGRVEGPIIGGNLILLGHLVRTAAFPSLAGALLLIEEVDEKPYSIDRCLTSIELCGALDRVAGALVGDFTACVDPKYPAPDAHQVADERLRAFALAGLRGAPIGHGARNRAVPFGGRCALDLDRGTAELLEPAVG